MGSTLSAALFTGLSCTLKRNNVKRVLWGEFWWAGFVEWILTWLQPHTIYNASPMLSMVWYVLEMK
jgi:hypothetical protein